MSSMTNGRRASRWVESSIMLLGRAVRPARMRRSVRQTPAGGTAYRTTPPAGLTRPAQIHSPSVAHAITMVHS